MPPHLRSHVRLLRGAAVVASALAPLWPAAAQLAVRETSLGVRPSEVVPHTVQVSASMRLGYVVATPAGDAVVVDGVRGPLYPYIDTEIRWSYVERALRRSISFSPDGKRFAYMAKQSDGARVVVDGTAGPLFDAVYWESIPFSPDGRHVAYLAAREGSYVAVRDGVVGRKYDAIRSLEFSADSKHVTYVAQRDGLEYVVVDGKEGKAAPRAPAKPMVSVVLHNGLPYAVPGKPGQGFITTAGRVVTLERRGDMWDVSIDGVPCGLPGSAYPYAVASPNGRRIACVVGRAGGWFVGVDGVAGPAYKDIANVTFSPDDRHLAYTAKRGDKWMIVVDGKESPAYDEIVGFPATDHMGRDSLSVLVRRGTEDLRMSISWPQAH